MPEMPDWKSLVEERLRTLRCETPAEPDLTAELAQHLEDYYRELCSGGASEEEAYQRTLSELDDVYPLRAEVERSNRMAKYDAVPAGDARPGNLFEDFCRDLGYGGRAIRKSPLFTLAAVLCLGMGIGANTTVFTIINTLLLHPLPASDPSRLVVLYDAQASRRTQQWSQPGLAYANLQDYMAGQKCFRSVAAFTWPQVLTLAGTNGPGRMFGELVSGQYFDTLGLTPALGRFFLPSEAREPGSAPVAVMSYGAWQARYGGARDILGRTLELNNIAFKVIGVAPKDFLGVSAVFGPDVWLPATISERLSPAGLLPTIQREVRATDSNIEMSDARTGAMLLDQVLWGPKVGVALLGVFGSLALVLASVGLYGVMAYSVSRRRREIGVRMALGATPAAVLRLVVTQGMKLVGWGIVFGLGASLLLSHGLSHMLFGLGFADPASLAAASVTLTVVALAACYLPAATATRIDPMNALREN